MIVKAPSSLSFRHGTAGSPSTGSCSWKKCVTSTLLPMLFAFVAGVCYRGAQAGGMVLYFLQDSSGGGGSSSSSPPPKIAAAMNLAPFDDTLIPRNTVVDVNIGTNTAPLGQLHGRHRILVDPLFEICDRNAKLAIDDSVTAFCFAVSNNSSCPGA